MAVTPTNVDAWIPEEKGGPVLMKIRQTSAVEDLARPEKMTSLTKKVPRDGGVTFEGATAKSTAIAKDTSDNDTVLLTARKLARIVEFAEEDIADTSSVADVIRTKQLGWATAYGVGFDNATLACTGTENGTTIPYTSLYKVLATTDAGIPDGTYTANSNITVSASGMAVTYDNLSNTFGLVEDSAYWSEGDMIVIASPSFRKLMRGIKDSQNRPVFIEAQSQANGTPDTLFGLPIRWSLGARKSAVSTNKPTGNPLLFIGNRQFLIRGDRSGPEYMFAGPDSGPAFEVDDALLKFRTRRGFAVGNPFAWACLEAAA